MNLQQRYELTNYLNAAETDPADYKELQEIWDSWHCMILIEANQSFFDRDMEALEADIQKELNKEIFFLNLNVRQSIVLLRDEKADFIYIANHIYTFLKLRYPTRFHMAVSERFTGHENLPLMLRELERWMESKFYHIEDHIFSSEEAELAVTGKEIMDHRLIEKIAHDVTRIDSEPLWKHFNMLESKYQDTSLFSAVYVKFVFGKVLEALFQDEAFSQGRDLVEEISHIYTSRNASEVLAVARKNIEAYSAYAEQVAKDYEERIGQVVSYVRTHYEEDINAVTLGDKFDLLPGYLMFQLRVHTGLNLNRLVHMTRMENARKLLASKMATWQEVAQMAGYRSINCFAKMFYQYFGESPERV
ncbi:MAG: helix-turn-helix transcriptional regulator [Clostridiales bacterium]|nr:helix-turn-helix transcriptional regulator [Candidatus Blautia equi]